VKTLDDLLGEGVSGRRVLVRADLNVPFDKNNAGVITDDGRARAVLPTLARTASPLSSVRRSRNTCCLRFRSSSSWRSAIGTTPFCGATKGSTPPSSSFAGRRGKFR